MTSQPTIRTQSDLETVWRDLMEPLGFTGHSIWMMFIDREDHPIPQLTQIEDAVDVQPADLVSLADIVRDLIDRFAPGGRVAFLRTRPGRDTADRADRELAASLVAACRRVDQPVEVVHFANDVLLSPLPVDDPPLTASA